MIPPGNCSGLPRIVIAFGLLLSLHSNDFSSRILADGKSMSLQRPVDRS